MQKAKTGIILAAVAVIFCFLFAASALAIGIGIAPTHFELADALRGEAYFCSFLLLNPGEQEATYLLRAEGEAGDWISFHPDRETAATINAVTVPMGSRTQIAVRFTIPETAADGIHTASIVVESAQQGGSGDGESGQASLGGASVVLRAHADVTIEVTGTKVVSSEATSVVVEEAVAASPTLAPTYVEHVVQKGENLTRIAQGYGVSVQAIVAANDIRNPSLIYIGQRLRIPVPEATPLLAAEPTSTATAVPVPTEVPPTQVAASPEAPPMNTPASQEAQPTLQTTPVVITAEQAQAAMAAMAQAAGCTPQVAVVGAVLCGSVVMRRRQRG